MCRELDIAVPEQVAVIGVDNDARLCRLCTPPLSSVIPDTHRTGYEAAQLLDRMMRGEKVGDRRRPDPAAGHRRAAIERRLRDRRRRHRRRTPLHPRACLRGHHGGRRAARRPPVAADAGASLPETGSPHATRRDHPHPHGTRRPAACARPTFRWRKSPTGPVSPTPTIFPWPSRSRWASRRGRTGPTCEPAAAIRKRLSPRVAPIGWQAAGRDQIFVELDFSPKSAPAL